jgi:hypothetical protein
VSQPEFSKDDNEEELQIVAESIFKSRKRNFQRRLDFEHASPSLGKYSTVCTDFTVHSDVTSSQISNSWPKVGNG